MRDRTPVLLIAFVILVADQVAKAVVSASIPVQRRVPLIDGFLALSHVENYGAAFGLFSGAPAGPLRVALIVVSILAVVLIWVYAREGWHEPRIVTAFGLILGGAVGNLVDRVRLGYVGDFIDVHWRSYHWPSFNVADAAITGGAVALFLTMARQSEPSEEAVTSASTEPAGGDLANLSTHERPSSERAAAGSSTNHH